MNDPAGRRRHVAVEVDVRHDVVAEPPFVLPGPLEVEINEPFAHLRERRVGDRQPEFGLGLGEREPEPAPGPEAAARGEEALHLRRGVPPAQGVVVAFVCFRHPAVAGREGDGGVSSPSEDKVAGGVPAVPLDDLYSATLSGRLGPTVRVVLGSKVGHIDPNDSETDYYVSTVPFDRVESLLPGLGLTTQIASFEHSPLTGIHLWFDRPITQLEHAMLLDREIQWIFHKGDGYYLVVVSASRGLEARSTGEIVALALHELCEFFPDAGRAKLTGSRVIREARATYSARPGLERLRPGPKTRYPNVFLAGDWTDSGWPATMEGAVRSGYRAADAVIEAALSR